MPGFLHASLSSLLEISPWEGKGVIGDPRGRQGPGGEGGGGWGESTLGSLPSQSGRGIMGRAAAGEGWGLVQPPPCKPDTVLCPARSRGRIRTQLHGERGLPGPHRRRGNPTHQPRSTIHPVPTHSPYTDWHRHSRWLCGDLRPLRIN